MLTTLTIKAGDNFTTQATQLAPSEKQAITTLQFLGYDFTDLDMMAFVGFGHVVSLNVAFSKHNGQPLKDDDFATLLLAFRFLQDFRAVNTGFGNASAAQLPASLTRLDLSFTDIDDGVLSELLRLDKLTHLSLQGTKVTAQVGQLSALQNLGKLDISHCKGIQNPESLSQHLTQPSIQLVAQSSSLLTSPPTRNTASAAAKVPVPF